MSARQIKWVFLLFRLHYGLLLIAVVWVGLTYVPPRRLVRRENFLPENFVFSSLIPSNFQFPQYLTCLHSMALSDPFNDFDSFFSSLLANFLLNPFAKSLIFDC